MTLGWVFQPTSEKAVDAVWRERRSENEYERKRLEDRHREHYSAWIEKKAAEYKKLSLSAILQELSITWGASWSDIARMADVSVPALRKWRADGGATPIKKARLASIAAFMHVLSQLGIEEPADWIAAPIIDGFTVAPRHLYTPANAGILIEFATGTCPPDSILDTLAPSWRQYYATGFDVVTLPGGEKALVDRKREDG